MTSTLTTTRIAIIGCGNVGTACAYALLLSSTVRELILIDHDSDKARGEAMDLEHAVPLGAPVRVMAGSYKDAAESAIVILTAGVPSTPGESRLDLLDRNVTIVIDCVHSLMAENFNGILLITTNPVDILAHVAQKVSGLPACRVIGSGTTIDTARLRAMLGIHLSVEARAIHAFVIGEHGDSSLVAWSSAHIGGIPLTLYPGADRLPSETELVAQVRQSAPKVVELKGNTCFAIASCVTRICEAILHDEHTILPVSTLIEGPYGIHDTYLSTPCILGADGVERVLTLQLDDAEHMAIQASAKTLHDAVSSSANARSILVPAI